MELFGVKKSFFKKGNLFPNYFKANTKNSVKISKVQLRTVQTQKELYSFVNDPAAGGTEIKKWIWDFEKESKENLKKNLRNNFKNEKFY